MDVTGILSELRFEREDIERAILSLERFDWHSTGTTEAAAQAVLAKPFQTQDLLTVVREMIGAVPSAIARTA